MISVFKGASVSAVGTYFKQPDYYSKDGNGSEGIWLGKGAKELGLYNKTVINADFVKYLDGQFPGRNPMGKTVGGERQRTPGWDNTVSSPPRASVAIEVFGDHELDKNHDKSARNTAKFIEAETLSLKIWNNENEKQDIHKSQKGLVAAFRHRTSRNLDPNTHTHLFFINAALHKDGTWRSADSQTSFYESKMLHGIIFRSEEAYGAKALGREISTYTKDGKHYWDLKHIDEGLAESFSSRSEEIKAHLGPGKHSAVAKAHAAKVTRKSKQSSNLENLKEQWRNKVRALGYVFEKVKAKLLTKNKDITRRSSRTIYNYAVNHLSEGNSSFTRNELLHAILSRGLGDIRFPNAKREIDRAVREKRLILREDNEHASGRIYTTPELKDSEREIVKLEVSGRGSRAPLFTRHDLSRHLEGTDLNSSQRLSLQQVALSTSFLNGIQGLAGSGKSFAAKRIVEAAELQGLKPILLAPSSSVTSDLTKDIQRQARTLQSYLLRPDGSKKNIIILDEASMVGTKDMLKFIRIAKERNINRVVLMGDTKQLSAAQAGSPFALLQDAGMRTSIIDKVIRQEDIKYQQMIKHAYEGNVDEVIYLLGKNLKGVGYEQIDQQAVQAWIKSKNPDAIAIVTNTNARADHINAEIKSVLKTEGKIKDGIIHQTYKSQNVSETDQSHIGNYVHADAIQFFQPYKSLGIKANVIYKISDVDSGSGKVRLQDPKGKPIIFTPEKSAQKMGSINLLKATEMELGVGDKVMFTANSYNHKTKNKEKFRVVDMNQNTVRLKTIEDGFVKDISLNDPALKFLRHAWAGTNHATQGKSVKGVIVAMSANERMTDKSSFYVAISRFKQNVKVFTDDEKQFRHVLNVREVKPSHALTRSEMLAIAAEVKQRDIEREKQKTLEVHQENTKVRTQHIGMGR